MAGGVTAGQPVAPFKRILTADPARGGPTQGTDVVATKRVASRLDCWPWQQFDDVFHPEFSHGVGQAKMRSGVAGLQTKLGFATSGDWTQELHDATLAMRVPNGLPHAGEWVWDQSALDLYRKQRITTEAQQLVSAYYETWDVLVANNGIWTYNEHIRPIDPIVHNKRPLDGGILDCSGTCIAVGWWVKCKPMDPVLRYGGFGATDTLRHYGVPIPEADIDKWAGDHLVLAFYGADWNRTVHVVAVKSAAAGDVYSNGRPEAPERVSRVRHRADFLGLLAYDVI
jgi:hypothetical protein